jgi:hypothetical protein
MHNAGLYLNVGGSDRVGSLLAWIPEMHNAGLRPIFGLLARVMIQPNGGVITALMASAGKRSQPNLAYTVTGADVTQQITLLLLTSQPAPRAKRFERLKTLSYM